MLIEVYDDTAPTDKLCKEWFDVSRMEISTLKTSLALDSQKNSRQRIRGITRRRSESNAKGACRIIGDNSTSHFCMIESQWDDSK